MKAEEICRTAGELVANGRKKTHGDKKENHQHIATLWEAYLWRRGLLRPDVVVKALDVANMMELLKIARRLCGDHNIDDYIDGAGYAALAGQIASDDQAG